MDINSQEHIKTIAPDIAKAYQLGKEQKYDEAYQVLVPHFAIGCLTEPPSHCGEFSLPNSASCSRQR